MSASYGATIAVTPMQADVAAQAAREAAQAAQQAAQVAAAQAQTVAHLRQVAQEMQVGATPPALPGEPKVTVDRDGKMTVISRDGGTTILYPDGRTTHVRPNGEVEQTGVPGGTDEPIPHQVEEIVFGFFFTVAFIAVGLPVARAFARRLDRSGAKGRAGAELPAEFGERMDRLEHAVDSVAIEVERISEGQRFTTKLMSEMRPAPAQIGGVHGEAGGPVRREAATVPAGERRS